MRNSNFPIGGWVKSSLIDFPGTVSTVLFFSGCNLRCPYCHNPEFALNTNKQPLSLEKIFTHMKKRVGIIEGVVLSGGEPTLHSETAMMIISAARKLRYQIKLDTNGMLPDIIETLSPDYLALDVKTLPSDYGIKLGASYTDSEERLMKSIKIAKSMNEHSEIRITVVPEIINQAIIEQLATILDGVSKVYLQPMQQKAELLDPHYKEIPPVSMEKIEIFRDILSMRVEHCEIRGRT